MWKRKILTAEKIEHEANMAVMELDLANSGRENSDSDDYHNSDFKDDDPLFSPNEDDVSESSYFEEGVVKLIEVNNGSFLGELKVEEEHTNQMKMLHSGLIATAIDAATSWAFFTYKPFEGKISVSVNLDVRFFDKANLGDEILVNAKVNKVIDNLGFLTCTLSHKSNGDIVAVGDHVKFVLTRKS
ncbi:hypothetical protein FQA39_LY00617 [Lamprigera yunnana]|nr:hypothetical protein FQA39_LY00617 [Lamprigera yunnana]